MVLPHAPLWGTSLAYRDQRKAQPGPGGGPTRPTLDDKTNMGCLAIYRHPTVPKLTQRFAIPYVEPDWGVQHHVPLEGIFWWFNLGNSYIYLYYLYMLYYTPLQITHGTPIRDFASRTLLGRSYSLPPNR